VLIIDDKKQRYRTHSAMRYSSLRPRNTQFTNMIIITNASKALLRLVLLRKTERVNLHWITYWCCTLFIHSSWVRL